MWSLGFDFGSVCTKAVLLDEARAIRRVFRQERGLDEADALAAFLDALRREEPERVAHLGLTGSGRLGALDARATQVNGILAVGAGARVLYPAARAIIEVGGQTAKYLLLDAEGGLLDFTTNEACAAGTGAFLEQQARRLNLTAPELSTLAAQAAHPATIAGRCSVFAASDMIHLQQKGTAMAEIAYGLCMAIVRNFLSTLLKGREVELPVLIAGGCAHNLGILRAFRAMVPHGSADTVPASPAPGLEAAVGAASLAFDGPALTLDACREVLRLRSGRSQSLAPFPPLRPPDGAPAPAEPEGARLEGAAGFLGLDVGSVSTDLVLLEPGGEVLSSVYLPTRGRPAEALREGLAQLEARYGGRLRVLGCGTTGSGRYLAARLTGADVVKNEITCQLLGARRYVPDVDTILEIGGQDAKFITVQEGALADFTMNKVCAAGTGSFLEERARGLGVEIRGAFAARAFRGAAPVDLGSRCTVFMETEVVNALAQGAAVEDLCAGLAYAIVKNYLDRVVGNRPLGRRIVFQGGVASNEAVVAAFQQVLGRPVQVHPFNRISGAIGAALAAREAVSGPSLFRGFPAGPEPVQHAFECQQCPNRCEVNVLDHGAAGGGKAYFGDTCERYTSGGTAQACRVPNLAQEYLERCEEALAPDLPERPRIGLPRASGLMGNLPFWAAFWRILGFQPVLSGATAQETLALGLKHLAVGVCLPIKLAVGHCHALLAQGVHRLFVPSLVHFPGAEPSHTYACPYTMAMPFLLDALGDVEVLTPVLSFESEEVFADGFEACRQALGLTREQVVHAFRQAMPAQSELHQAFRARASGLLAAGAHRHAFALLGRPYNLFDSFVNLGLFERLRRMDVLALPMAFLPLEGPPQGGDSGLPWRYAHDLFETAARLETLPGVHPVILSNYGCGPDAFTLQQLGEALRGRSHLVLELDEHRGEAGLVTRVEAFLDQLEGAPRAGLATRPVEAAGGQIPTAPTTLRIPYFADHAFANSGLFKGAGHDARVLPLPGPEALALGERHALGKECHPYAMLLGDLLTLDRERHGKPCVYFFPGTSIPCLLHEYGQGMQTLLRTLGIHGLEVCAPAGDRLFEAMGLKAMERFYTGLLAIEILVKAVCQIRPYELEPGTTDFLHDRNLERIEAAVAFGDVLGALDEALGQLAKVPMKADRHRPVVGLVGDLYTRVNPVANHDLVRWLEAQGLEVWPSPFQIDLLDLGIARNLSRSLSRMDLPNLLSHGKVAMLRALHAWRVRSVVGSRVARQSEPGYLELKRMAAPYMPNEAHELLFLHVAKTVDFARSGVNGIVNAICFGCMVGNAAAAVNEKIRRDFNDLPILTAVYAGGDDPARQMALEAFVSQVRHHRSRVPASAG